MSPTNDISFNHCKRGALTGSLGLFVQALLALLAFCALIVKRFCEPAKTRRKWKTWWFDTSKQAVGAGLIHVINVILSEHLFTGDPCTWYIITFLLDSTLGLFIICILLKLLLKLIIAKNWHHLIFGIYCTPSPWKSWLGQCSVYVFVIIIEKILITFLTLLSFWKTQPVSHVFEHLSIPFWVGGIITSFTVVVYKARHIFLYLHVQVGEWVLSHMINAELELTMVMFVIPLVVNVIIFWVVDNYLKLHHPSSPEMLQRRHSTSDPDCNNDDVAIIVCSDEESTCETKSACREEDEDVSTGTNRSPGHHRTTCVGGSEELLSLTKNEDGISEEEDMK